MGIGLEGHGEDVNGAGGVNPFVPLSGTIAAGELPRNVLPGLDHVGQWLRPNVQPRQPSPWIGSYRRSAVLGDLLFSSIAVAVVFMFRYGTETPRIALVGAALVPLLWVACLSRCGAYARSRIGVGLDEYRSVGAATVALLAVFGVLALASTFTPSRLFVLMVVPAVFTASVMVRFSLRQRLGARRRQGVALQSTVVVGHGLSVAEIICEIQEHPGSTGLDVVAACVADLGDLTDLQTSVGGVPIFGPPDSAIEAVDRYQADTVVVLSHPELAGQGLRRLSWALADRKVTLLVAPGIAEVAGARLSLQPRGGMSLLYVERPIMSGFKMILKRITDLTLAAAVGILAIPVMLALGLAVWLDDRGPILYRQQRVGERARSFDMFKFRTMVVDAEARLEQAQTAHQVNSTLFKNPHDPRITRVGRWLRRYSLDELPQLINVLRGEMSLVGPRPPLLREVALYDRDAAQRLRVRPGMTGLWQISGRSDLDWERSLRLDLWYVDNWTPLVDLQILLRTVRAVLSGSGAY